MKKFFIIAIAMLGFVTMASATTNVIAYELGINTHSAATVSYLGGFTSVNMNGEPKNPVSDKVTTVVSDGNTISSLKSESFQVGKMPGSILISASNLTINTSTGGFSGPCSVKLTILNKPAYYTGTIVGSVTRLFHLEIRSSFKNIVIL